MSTKLIGKIWESGIELGYRKTVKTGPKYAIFMRINRTGQEARQ